MTISDKKQFNIIDVLIILVLLAILAYSAKKVMQPKELKGTIDNVQVELTEITEKTVNFLEPGQLLYNPRYKKGRKSYGVIKEVISVVPMQISNLSLEGKMVVSDHPTLKTAVIIIAFHEPVEVFTNKFVYPNSSLRLNLHVDATFEFKSLNLKLLGKIINISFKPLESE